MTVSEGSSHSSVPQSSFADPTCDLCGGRLEVGFSEVGDPQTRERFSILRCPTCGLGHTSPQPADLGPYYGAKYHGGRHGITDRMCIARRLGYLKQLGRTSGRLLDFGCGDGSFLLAAAEAGFQGEGVEMNPRFARERGVRVAEVIEEVSGTFDVITLWHSLEHVRSPRKVIHDVASKLAPGGDLIVAVPNWGGLQARLFGPKWFHLDVPRHLFHFTSHSLDVLFAEEGLESVKTWHMEAELDLFGWTQSALNTIQEEPNVLFDVVTKRDKPHGAFSVMKNLALGTALTGAFAGALAPTALMKQGAIMVHAARARAT